MNDVERDLRERFARTETRLTGPDFAPPTAPAEVLRRTRRRQVGVAVVGLLAAVAVVAASIAGATALIRSSERRVPAEPPDTFSPGALEAVAAQPISFDGLVADAEGRLWSTWPVLTSFDPASGTIRTFTWAEDPAFAGAGPAAAAREGGVWLIAFGPGGELFVLRFDGERVVETSAPVPTDYLGAIAEALDGTVWVGGGGVFSWDGESWFEAPTTGRLSREAGDIAVDTAGNVWVKDIRFPGPEWLGISRFDGTAWTSYPVEEVLPSDRLGVPKEEPDRGALWTTVAGADGDVWVGGHGAISHFVDGGWTSYPSEELGLVNDVMSIAVANGSVWAAGTGEAGASGIARFDGTTWSQIDRGITIDEENQDTSVVEGGDRIWAAVNGALLRWDGEAFVQAFALDRPQEIMSPFVAVGRDELWTGDWGMGGAWRLVSDQWTHFEDRADLPGEVHGLALAPDGTLWATTKQGVWRFDGSRWKEIEGGDFQAVAFAPDGQPWAARSVPGTVIPHETAIGPVGGATLPIPAPLDPFGFRFVVVAADDVWAGSPGSWGIGAGLAHFDGTEWTRVTPVDGQPDFGVSGIEIAPNGDVWVSLVIWDPPKPNAPDPIVVARFDGSSWQVYREADGVSFGTLQQASGQLDLAPDGTPVLAAAPGLVEFHDGAWTVLQEGSFSNLSIAPDGTTWLSGNGLFRLPSS